jgi:hypothetical protein
MEQNEAWKPRKKGKLLLVLGLAAVMAAGIGLVGCDSPTNPGNSGGGGQKQEHDYKWTLDREETDEEWTVVSVPSIDGQGNYIPGKKTRNVYGVYIGVNPDGTQAEERRLLRTEEQTIDGTVIPQWMSEMTDAGKTDLHVTGSDKGNGNLTSAYKNLNSSVIASGTWRLLGGLAEQSKVLHGWADGVAIYPSDNDTYAAKFNAIVTAQANINAAVTGVDGSTNNKLADLPGKIDAEIEAMLQEIFGDASEDPPTPNSEDENPRDKFERYFSVYKQAMYLVNRDWLTVNGSVNPTEQTTLQTAYSTGITELKGLDGTEDDIKSMGLSGSTSYYAGHTLQNHAGLHGYGPLENALAGQIAEALGMGDNANVIATAKKLVIQIGQDTEELRTLADDLTGAAALQSGNSSYNTTANYSEILANDWSQGWADLKIASAETQSSQVKLASVNAQFSNGAVKTAYGKPFEEYTGGFTPYAPWKDGTEITAS